MAEDNGSTGRWEPIDRRIEALAAIVKRNSEQIARNSEQIMILRDVAVQSMDQISQIVQLMKAQHEEHLIEIRELITLQKEHRIDIMALFESQKSVKKRMNDIESKQG